MKKIFNKKIALLLLTILIILSGTIYLAINKKGNVFNSIVNKENKLADPELEDDNWEISVVFYDSTVDNGTTPLTEINWHSTERNDSRQITVQINYRNTNAKYDYEPRDLKIKVDTFKGRNFHGPYKNNTSGFPASAITAGKLENGYDWNVSFLTDGTYLFSNNNRLDSNTNYEGSLQLQYNLSADYNFGPLANQDNSTSIYALSFFNDSTENIKATLSYKDKEVTSNNISLNFSAEKEEYTVTQNKTTLSALDGLENANDYIWVKWLPTLKANKTDSRFAHEFYCINEVPENAVVYDENLNKLNVENNQVSISGYKDVDMNNNVNGTPSRTLYIGYPKDQYENTTITNKITAYGKYDDEEEFSVLSEDIGTANLANFEFNYSGNLYSIRKTDIQVYSIPAQNGISTNRAAIYPRTVYTGTTYDAIVGDDIMVVPYNDGTTKIMEDSDYNYTGVSIQSLKNGNNVSITGKTMDIYVRYANTNEFVEYPEKLVLGEKTSIVFEENNIVGIKSVIRDLDCGIGYGNLYYDFTIHSPNIASDGVGYNFAFLQIKQGDEIVNTPSSNSYPPSSQPVNIAEYDMEHYNTYLQRVAAQMKIHPNSARHSSSLILWSNYENIPAQELFKIQTMIGSDFDFEHGKTDNFYGHEIVLYLPEGMDVYSSESDIINNAVSSIKPGNYADEFNYQTKSGLQFDSVESFKDYYRKHISVEIMKNYKNTNRTVIKVRLDFRDDPMVIAPGSRLYFTPRISPSFYTSVSYDSLLEYGNTWSADAYVFFLNEEDVDYTIEGHDYNIVDTEDLNDNGNTTETFFSRTDNVTITGVVESHQDVQTSVQTDQSNFATGTVKTSKDSEYTYKLRVRTGQSDVTNLVVYDSIEDYAKNPNLEIVKASDGKPSWQGGFLGVDTSYAESKGYNVKVYYNENPNPGTLAEDTTWQEYTDTTDKSLVKALAFKYLDSDGNPAVLPANTNTYVLIKMKAPDADYITYAYNGCWTEWNAIDSLTGRPVDFITGINSNIVKVALPNSREIEYAQKTLQKEWVDGDNALGLRPQQVKYMLIPNDDVTKATEVILTGTGNNWQTTVSVPAFDDYGIPIIYSILELTIEGNNDYVYMGSKTDTFKYTNTLNKKITLTKIWKDNTDAYLTRPSSVTFQIKQNGNNYKTHTFGGDLSSNEWTKNITLPVYDNNGNEYTYIVEEAPVDGYSSSCNGFTCTNTLTGTETFTIKKVWQDNNNEYGTRPSSIDIRLKRNGEVISTYTLSGSSNTWETSNIITNKYDENGVKYVYTIDETPLDEYGLVTYDQANHKVTNTLKKNISITVTKKWVDGSNEQGLRPDSLTINLLRNNSQYQELTLTGTGDTWSTTIEVPKYDDNQQEYKYSIQELTDNLNEDYSNITYSEQELSVTNKLEKKVSIKVKKIWDDSDNELLTRPESLNINLLRNGTLYQELTLTPEDISDNTWELNIADLDAYDSNGARYTYTIEENLIDQLSRYETITYDQTNYTITNKLTVPPKVTLFFTVKNGYIPTGGEEIQYDEDGYNSVLSQYNLNGDDEYTFNFELENVDTGEIIKGKLSTQGTLEFDNVPYGTYRAREGEDRYFDFVSMVEIELVLGVSFTPDDRGGTITITPTGQDIVYGAHITNKIAPPIYNPETYTGHKNIFLYLILLTIGIITGLYFYRRYRFVK